MNKPSPQIEIEEINKFEVTKLINSAFVLQFQNSHVKWDMSIHLAVNRTAQSFPFHCLTVFPLMSTQLQNTLVHFLCNNNHCQTGNYR